MSSDDVPAQRGVLAEADAGQGRGVPGRVAAVHEQARRGLGMAVAFALAAVLAGLARVGDGWWVPLHLFTVGALLSAISATTQMLAVTWSAAPAPHRRAVVSQRWFLAAGAVALVTGREAGLRWLLVAGGVIVVVATLALVPILLQVRHRAVTGRFGPAIEAYAAAALAGAAGMSLGIVIASGHGGTRTMELRGAHLILNLLGLTGLVVAGTLPFFTATQVRARMSRAATPARIRLVLWALALGMAFAATATVAGRPGLAAAGLGAYALGLVGIAAMLPVYDRRRLAWAGPRVAQLLAGVGWWVTMTVALAVVVLRGSSDRAVLQALVIGGFAQILVASLAYLGPVLRGGGHRRLTAGFALTRSWPSLVAGNAAAAAALAQQRPVMMVALTAWAIDVVVRALLLLMKEPDHV